MIAAKPLRSPFLFPGSMSLVLASIVTLVVLAFHPQIHTHSTGEMLQQLADASLGAQAAHVHGALTVVLALLLYGVTDLANALGLRRTPVAFGLAAYALGTASVVAAMLFDGFITSQLAGVLLEKMAARDAASGILQAAPVVFALVSVTIQVATKAGFVAMGAGMCFLSWSAAGRARAFGWLGLGAGLLPAVIAVAHGVWLRPHQLMAITACQAVWYLAAAFLLGRLKGETNRNPAVTGR